jgi:hypothetical protein
LGTKTTQQNEVKQVKNMTYMTDSLHIFAWTHLSRLENKEDTGDSNL